MALAVFAVGISLPAAESAVTHYATARGYMAEAKHTSNAVRLAWLGWEIGDELERTVELDPSQLDARADLVRYYVVTPRIVGGNLRKARQQAAELARRDPALGAWATGYIAYRGKEYGPARKQLQRAVQLAKTPSDKALALTWLGWLSQETQQYDDAFAAFDQLLATDPKRIDALYEIGRTALFSGRELDRGEASLKRFIAATPTADMPSRGDAHAQLALLYDRRGDPAAAKRELQMAIGLDPDSDTVKKARSRLE
jgi:tetratricopeptide (TPR) repeat protein